MNVAKTSPTKPLIPPLSFGSSVIRTEDRLAAAAISAGFPPVK